MHGPPRAALMRDRRSEQSHDTITGVLVNRALEAVHLCRDMLEAAIDDLVHDLRVELFSECGEVGHVGEQHGDLAALPFERTAGGQNLLHQVTWCVALDF